MQNKISMKMANFVDLVCRLIDLILAIGERDDVDETA